MAFAPQVAIITGSGQGVGAAAAKLFAEQGAKVVVTDIDAGKSEQVRPQRYIKNIFWCRPLNHAVAQVASSIREAGGEALSVPGDVTAEDFAPKIIKATIEEYGALHILVNNAGDLSCTCHSCMYASFMLLSQSLNCVRGPQCCCCMVQLLLVHCSLLRLMTLLQHINIFGATQYSSSHNRRHHAMHGCILPYTAQGRANTHSNLGAKMTLILSPLAQPQPCICPVLLQATHGMVSSTRCLRSSGQQCWMYI